MIGIKVNNGFLELGKEFNIQIDLVSPVFSFEIGYGSTSLKFSIPNSPKNRHLLDHADLVLNTNTINSYNAEVYLKGRHWRSALLNVVEASNTFSVSLDLSESKLARLLDSYNMQDFNYGGTITIPGSGTRKDLSVAMVSHANFVAQGLTDPGYYFFPIRNDNMHESTIAVTGPGEYMNYYRNDTFYDALTYTAAFGGNSIQNLVPFPKLRRIITESFEEIGYAVKDSLFMTDAELDKICIYNNRTLNRSKDIYRNFINLNQHVPSVSARLFYQGLSRMFNLAPIIDEVSQTVEFIDLAGLVASKEQVDWRNKVINYSLNLDYSLDLSLFSEQDENDRLLSNLQKPEPEETITGSVFDYASLPGGAADGDIYYVGERNAFYRYEATTPGWEFFSWRAFEELVGAGETQRWSNISTTMVTRDTWYSPEIWRVPYVDQYLTGIDPTNKLEKWPFAPRLLFYRGLSGGSPQYPVGTPDDVDGAYDYSLYWHGTNGLFEKWHKPWTDLIGGGKDVTFFFLFNINDISTIDWTKKTRVRVREGSAWGYVKKLRVNFTRDGVNPVEAEMVIV